MSWTKSASASAEGARWYSLLGGRSIAAHIARLYTLSAIVLLSIVIGLLYWVESRSLEWEMITLYQRVSLLLVLVGILASALVGALIARSGMEPLRSIARAAEQITASRLHQRLQPERWPLELFSLAKAFDGMLGRLDDSCSRMAQFSADLAHELRTPIQIMMGQTEVALAAERGPAEYRQVLASNLEEFQRITRIINQLLFLARAENPKSEFERSWLEARDELEATREFHEALAEEHGVTVTCVGKAALYANPLLIRRAVTNLLSNSLRHTPRGGQITLSAQQTQDHGVVLQVSDTGCGIRSEDLPKVCERLFCSHQGSARCAEGMGLGLAIVKSIAELHGGTAALDSRAGEGTTVTLRFPAPEKEVEKQHVLALAA